MTTALFQIAASLCNSLYTRAAVNDTFNHDALTKHSQHIWENFRAYYFFNNLTNIDVLLNI